MNLLDRMILQFAPRWGLSRARARAAAQVLGRHFEAAAYGRRTANWSRSGTDANAAAAGSTLAVLRAQARDDIRNNPWARRGARRIASNTVGWGIRPKASGAQAARIGDLWRRWAETTDCDADGRLTFYGLQRQVMASVVADGEVLIRRRFRRPSDGLAIPLQLQLLEADFLDPFRNNMPGQQGGIILQGVEFDAIGRRIAYWLFDRHPGSLQLTNPVSKRIPAEEILHVFYLERPGQIRGPSWFAPVDVRLHELDEYEDATLMKQKIAACFAAFVTDVDGAGTPLGENSADDPQTDTIEPGLVSNLPIGKQVTFSNPPQAADHPSFTATALRGIAAGLGVTYEDLTGDYSQVNFSSARMSRLAHHGDVHDWRWNMLVPLFCTPAWDWMIGAAQLGGALEGADRVPAEWTPPATPMIDPEKEGLALQRLVRAGARTHDEMVREQGYDPDAFWREYAAGLKRLDDLGIWLDSDVRKVTVAGQSQQKGDAGGGKSPLNGKTPPNGAGDGATQDETAEQDSGDAVS